MSKRYIIMTCDGINFVTVCDTKDRAEHICKAYNKHLYGDRQLHVIETDDSMYDEELPWWSVYANPEYICSPPSVALELDPFTSYDFSKAFYRRSNCFLWKFIDGSYLGVVKANNQVEAGALVLKVVQESKERV